MRNLRAYPRAYPNMYTNPYPDLLLPPQAYKEIEAKYVTENVFSQFCYKTLPNPSHLWLFKKQLCMQMALSGAQAQHLATFSQHAPSYSSSVAYSCQ